MKKYRSEALFAQPKIKVEAKDESTPIWLTGMEKSYQTQNVS
jgi:hypothetical protein